MRKRLIILLLCLNIAIFILTIAFLPQVGSYSYRNAIDKIINSRCQWEIAWMILTSSIILSIGIYVFVEGHYK